MISVRADAEEYDPARPNDYNDVRDAREAQRKEAEQEVVRQERLKAAQAVGPLRVSAACMHCERAWILLNSSRASKHDLQHELCRTRTDLAVWGSLLMQLSISG